MQGYMKGAVDENLSLGTLNPLTLVSVIFDETVSEKALVASIVCNWSMRDFTVTANDGPIMVGVAHSDYTDAEIEEVIENAGSWNTADKIQQREVGRRLVRIVGTFPAAAQSGGSTVLNDGRNIKTRLNWMLATGQTLRLWAYNLGTSALGTTVPTVHLQGHANLFNR